MVKFDYDQATDSLFLWDTDNPDVIRAGPIVGDTGVIVELSTRRGIARENAVIPPEFTEPVTP